MSVETLKRYYDAFNAGDTAAMIDELSDEFSHDVNEGETRLGKEAFGTFCDHMSECYKEVLTDMTLFVSDDGSRGAAEFIVNGTYLKTDPGLPEAHGQSYKLPAGAFFSLSDGKITRVTTYYNLNEWTKQVSQ
ncbi:ketosteroid isomerase-related protein [Cochlodiniinecator piscidefendens]|uniref:ketosteroid isomerase-related protein n=1 Tax=Cochlodiniinecator piscidefendens TaxID=2715756 RepID=UPI001409C776|nr:ketosteroid isomerase-related protein [Cochlodiniinecator piscidefendens]